jgi:hypothetical protein
MPSIALRAIRKKSAKGTRNSTHRSSCRTTSAVPVTIDSVTWLAVMPIFANALQAGLSSF